MSNATSIVGIWNGFVAWGCSGLPVSNSSTVWTFHANGNALDGIMGYPVAGSSPGTGCFYAVREKEPGAAAAEVVPASHDLTKGPHKK
jgi:hypothetical protein